MSKNKIIGVLAVIFIVFFLIDVSCSNITVNIFHDYFEHKVRSYLDNIEKKDKYNLLPIVKNDIHEIRLNKDNDDKVKNSIGPILFNENSDKAVIYNYRVNIGENTFTAAYTIGAVYKNKQWYFCNEWTPKIILDEPKTNNYNEIINNLDEQMIESFLESDFTCGFIEGLKPEIVNRAYYIRNLESKIKENPEIRVHP